MDAMSPQRKPSPEEVHEWLTICSLQHACRAFCDASRALHGPARVYRVGFQQVSVWAHSFCVQYIHQVRSA